MVSKDQVVKLFNPSPEDSWREGEVVFAIEDQLPGGDLMVKGPDGTTFAVKDGQFEVKDDLTVMFGGMRSADKTRSPLMVPLVQFTMTGGSKQDMRKLIADDPDTAMLITGVLRTGVEMGLRAKTEMEMFDIVAEIFGVGRLAERVLAGNPKPETDQGETKRERGQEVFIMSNVRLGSDLEQTQDLAEEMTPEALRAEVEGLMAANGGEIPSVPGLPYIKVNHGLGYNAYDAGGIGEGIWVRPISGDDAEGIGFLGNDSLNEGDWGDLVQYSTYNPSNKPIILVLAEFDDDEARQRQFERAEAE